MIRTKLLACSLWALAFTTGGMPYSLAQAAPAAARHTKAIWITHPTAKATDGGKSSIALQFRRVINLASKPVRYNVQITADNRYILYINGRRVAAGPSRGDLDHWPLASIDLAPYLHSGRNTIAIQVWNDREAAPRAQVSARTGLYLIDHSPYSMLNSGPMWHVRVDASRVSAPGLPQMIQQFGATYYVGGGPETHEARLQSKDWTSPDTVANDWVKSVAAVDRGPLPWTLVPDRLPQMAYVTERGGHVVRSGGLATSNFPDGPLLVPPHSDVSVLVDVGEVQAAYPEMKVAGGLGSEVTVTYGEALYDGDKKRLHDRSAIAGGNVLGLRDTFRPDGGARQTFQPFWWRTWRYAEIHVRTKEDPLRLLSFTRHRTGYPFSTKGYFQSSDADLNRIWQIGWNTLRLDAHETFMDTAYWEQMQYIGDTRIEALIADSVSGDHRLSEQALRAFDASRSRRAVGHAYVNKPLPELIGLPQAAWPSSQFQSIPPFALLWIGALHDYHLRQPDGTLIKDSLPGVRKVIDWFGQYIGTDGLVGKLPGWTFIDWEPNLQGDVFGGENKDSNDCVVSMLYFGALKQAALLEAGAGNSSAFNRDQQSAKVLGQAIQNHCWSAKRGLYSDSSSQLLFSQHANILAVLYDIAPKAEQSAIIDRVTVRGAGIAPPSGITGVSFYFSYYLARALDHAGLADRYLEMIESWRQLLGQNFTTWPETPDPSRSDSHGWSAHPTADLLALVAGIAPAKPSFSSVRISPHLGTLTTLDAARAHPRGRIEVSYRRHGQTLDTTITLPRGIRGQFDWKTVRKPLHPGANHFVVTERVQ